MNQEIWLVLFPLIAALVIPLLSTFLPGAGFARFLALAASAAGLVFGITLYPGILEGARSVVMGNWLPPLGINFFVSPFSLGMVLLLYAGAVLILLSDLGNREQKKPQYYLLYSLLTGASAGLVLSGDLFNIFVFLEIAGISGFSLIAAGKGHYSSGGALKYLIQAQVTSLAMLAGVALIYSASGNLNIASLGRAGVYNPAFAFLTAVLLLLPFLLEGKIFPFNTWVGDAYQGADPVTGAAVSGIAAAAGTAVIFRLVLTLMGGQGPFGPAAATVRTLLILLGALTAVLGEAAAFRETNLKRVLGFSSAGQTGMILVGIGVGGGRALEGALFLLFNHSAAKILLFIVGGFFIRAAGKSGWADLKGLGRRHPLAGGLFILGAMALLGLPLFAGFWGKLSLLEEAFRNGGMAAAGGAGILLGTILEGVYFMKIGHTLFEKTEPAEVPAGGTDLRFGPAAAIPALVLALALVAAGILPSLLQSWTEGSVRELLAPAAEYGRIILKGGSL